MQGAKSDDICFLRGSRAYSRARRSYRIPVDTVREVPVENSVDSVALNATGGALVIMLTGPRATSVRHLQVLVDDVRYDMTPPPTRVLRLPPGVFTVRVPQTRIGPNVGTVEIRNGLASVLRLRVGWLGLDNARFAKVGAFVAPDQLAGLTGG